MLEIGHLATIKELAAAEKINSSCVSRVLRLTLLMPDIAEAILDGRQPEGMTLPGFMEAFATPWRDQPALAALCSRLVSASIDAIDRPCDSWTPPETLSSR